MRRGDILLVRTHTLVGALIRKITKCEYNHVAMAVSPVAVFEATFPYGVRIIKMEYDNYILFRHPGMTEEKADSIVNLALTKIGAEYDIPLIIQILLKLWRIGTFNLNQVNKYICTEIINYLFSKHGLKLFIKNRRDNITPKDFLGDDCLLRRPAEDRR